MPNRIARFIATRRFRPTLVPTLALIAAVAATVSLGNWQRDRAVEKSGLRAQYDAAARAAPLALTGGESDFPALRYRNVRVSGEFDAARQILIDNKLHAGRTGYDVVTPLKIGDSERYVLVDRGWVALGARRAEPPAIPVPRGTVTIGGRLNFPPARYLELSADVESGTVRENLDIARVAKATSLALLPVIVEQVDPPVPPDELTRDWPEPDFGIAQHRSYMVQWYSLAALAVVLWLTLNWRPRGRSDGDAT